MKSLYFCKNYTTLLRKRVPQNKKTKTTQKNVYTRKGQTGSSEFDAVLVRYTELIEPVPSDVILPLYAVCKEIFLHILSAYKQ